MTEKTYRIEGLSCTNCAGKFEKKSLFPAIISTGQPAKAAISSSHPSTSPRCINKSMGATDELVLPPPPEEVNVVI